MELWDRMLAFFRMLRGNGLRHYELNERLQAVLVDRALEEQRPTEDIQDELLVAGLEQWETSNKLKKRWETLSTREKDVTALICLGYTNKQMAARMGISKDTAKGYVHQVLVKFNLHGKNELRMLLKGWDFSDWAPPAQM